MANPYGDCHHTKYVGCPPCIHDAYEAGKESMRAYLLADDENVYAQGYRDGFNDHAKARAKSEQMFGTYDGTFRAAFDSAVREKLDLYDRPNAIFNQHGDGENP